LDRKRPARVLIPGLLATLAAVGLIAAKASDLTVIHAARWLAPGADPVRALATHFSECLPRVADPEASYSVEVGRAAFRTPLLLGGQASRAGISCESCHQNGRNNPDFDFPGLSGAPGTADVTTSLFSTHRDDGIDNPRPIPDLSGPKSALTISQDAGAQALERRAHGGVTEEFDGAEPPPAVLKGLADYMRALSPAACPAQSRIPLRAEDDLDNAVRAVRVAASALARDDKPTAILLLEAARSQLGLVNERYDAASLARSRSLLAAASVDLASDIAGIRAGRPGADGRIAAWLAEEPGWSAVVTAQESQSLFNPARLAAAR
jgi:hypothetical protein